MKKNRMALVTLSTAIVLAPLAHAGNATKDIKDSKGKPSAVNLKKTEDKVAGQQKAASNRASSAEVKDFLSKASAHIVKAGGKDFTAAKLADVVKQYKESKADVDALSSLVRDIASGKITGSHESLVAHFLELKSFDTSGSAMPITPTALKKIISSWDVTATETLHKALTEATKRVASGATLESALKEALKLVGIENYEEFLTKCRKA